MHQDIAGVATDVAAIQTFIRKSNRIIASQIPEEPIRTHLASHLRQMFPGAPSWIDVHICGGETALEFHRERRGKTVTGFVDNLVGLTAIEYEKNLLDPKIFNEGFGQVKDYCAGLLNEGHPSDQILGVLSDSVRWHAYRVESVGSRNGALSRNEVHLCEIASIDVSAAGEAEAEQLARFLMQYLQRVGSRPLSAEMIGRDLGFQSEFCFQRLSGISRVVDTAFRERKDYAKLVAKLWVNFVSYVRAKDAEGFDRADYVRELYILTLGKLICANALLHKAETSNDEGLADILSGAFFQRHGLVNFVEYDYFGWLNSEEEYRNALIPIARDMQRDLRAYDFTRPFDEDIFGTLMSQLASASQRLLLGQEWTPSWLAGKMVGELLSQLAPTEAPRFIDMCCGSGSMMVEVVKQAKSRIAGLLPVDASAQERATKLAQAITGFDIDPLAVMLSKISWVLAARDWLGDPGAVQVTIPAFHADTLFAMTPLSKAIRGSKDIITLEMEEHAVEMPRFLVSSEFQRMFDAIIEKAYELSHRTDSKLPARNQLAAMTNNIAADCGVDVADPRLPEVSKFLESLTAVIWQLTRARRNGIWSFIIRNSYRPGLVSGQFNGLVSNPPWLALSKISANPYSVALKVIAKSIGLEPPGSASIHLEMSAVFLLHAVLHYLQPGAVVGCVMPETVLNGHHLQPFRTGKYSTAATPVPFSKSSVWQVDESTFKNRAAVVFGKREPFRQGFGPFPTKLVSPHSPDINGTFYVSVLGKMVVWAGEKGVIVLERHNPANFRQGADIMPRTLFLHEATNVSADRASIARISTDSSIHFYIAMPRKCKTFAIATPCIVPRNLLRCLITSTMVVPFIALKPPRAALLPIKRNADGVWEPLTRDDFDILPSPMPSTLMATFTTLAKELLESRGDALSGDPIQAIWDYQDTYRKKLESQYRLPAQGFLVLFGASGGNICAVAVSVAEWQDVIEDLVIDQTVYWAYIEDEDEALYLVGALNSTVVNERIKVFQPRGLADERHIHKLALGITPRFQPQNPVHRRMVSATRALVSQLDTRRAAMTLDPKLRKKAAYLVDPNRGLGSRRGDVRKIMEGLAGHGQYQAAAVAVYDAETESNLNAAA